MAEPPRTQDDLMASLQRVTDAALAHLPEQALLTELLHRISEILRSDTAAILLLDEGARVLRARAAKGIEEEVERRVQIPLGKGFAGRVAAERRAIAIEDVDHADIFNPILREKGIRSLLGVPLLVEDRVLGVLHVGSLVRRTFTEEDRALLQLAADRAAIAIEHASLYEQRRVAEALQQQLLPTDLSALPGVELASRYLPAAGESFGGDWYDAFLLTGGRVVVVVGDVVGHGVAAAAVMAQLRTALRAYAADQHPPAAVVERVNSLMWTLGPAAMTTLAYVVIDPERETLELVNAGHPPPLMIGADGEATFLPLQGGVALGATALASYRSETHPFPAGSTTVLYTDGLVESRDRPLDHGLEALRALGTDPGSVEELCSKLVADLVPEQRPDDIAIIAARLPVLPERLTGRWPADTHVLAGMRRLLRRWLHACGATEDEIYEWRARRRARASWPVAHARADRGGGRHAHRRRHAGGSRAHARKRMSLLARVLVVDLTLTTYLDSAGINLLFELYDELRIRQHQLRLVVAPGSPIARPITITGLDAVVPRFETRQAAIESVG